MHAVMLSLPNMCPVLFISNFRVSCITHSVVVVVVVVVVVAFVVVVVVLVVVACINRYRCRTPWQISL